MLYPVAGSSLFIADDPGAESLPLAGWTEIGEVEALGTLGGEWATEELSRIGQVDQDGTSVTTFVKDVLRRSPVQIVLGNDPADPGQAILWNAFRSRNPFPFRLAFPDLAATRSWFALVTSLGEVFDTANNVTKLQANLIPTSKIWRSEDT